MANTWILAANRSKARIFEMQKLHGPLVEVVDLVDPEGRAKDRDINSDADGRLYGKGERLRDYLERAHAQRRFAALWVVAPPAFLGTLREKLGKQLHGAIELEVNKDVPTHSADAIRDIALAERERQAERERRQGNA